MIYKAALIWGVVCLMFMTGIRAVYSDDEVTDVEWSMMSLNSDDSDVGDGNSSECIYTGGSSYPDVDIELANFGTLSLSWSSPLTETIYQVSRCEDPYSNPGNDGCTEFGLQQSSEVDGNLCYHDAGIMLFEYSAYYIISADDGSGGIAISDGIGGFRYSIVSGG